LRNIIGVDHAHQPNGAWSCGPNLWGIPYVLSHDATRFCMGIIVEIGKFLMGSSMSSYPWNFLLQCFDTVGLATGRHPVCKKLVGLLMVTIWLQLCTSF